MIETVELLQETEMKFGSFPEAGYSPEIEMKAWELIQTRHERERIEVKPQEHTDNARTALMEALTASGHLSRVEIHGETVEEINKQVRDRLVAGWDDSLPHHEKRRRFAELCEELLIEQIHEGIAEGRVPSDTAVALISDFPEALGSAATRLGYRFVNRKGMVRSTHLSRNEDGSYTRIIEQVSRSNSGWRSTFAFLAERQAPTKQDEPDISALQAPITYRTSELSNGVVDIIRRLDYYSGVGTMYGDQTANKNHVLYEDLRQESARREREIECYIDDLAKLDVQLAILVKKGMTQAERDTLYLEEVDRILAAICTLAPNYAKDTYGEKSAQYFYAAADLVSRGLHNDARALLESTKSLRETVTFCGMEISVKEAQEMGLKVSSYGELLEKGRNSWKWKQGICRVQSCPTRPGKTEVGPCDVCRGCQAKFDKGKDPTRTNVPFKKSKQAYPKVKKKHKIKS